MKLFLAHLAALALPVALISTLLVIYVAPAVHELTRAIAR